MCKYSPTILTPLASGTPCEQSITLKPLSQPMSPTIPCSSSSRTQSANPQQQRASSSLSHLSTERLFVSQAPQTPTPASKESKDYGAGLLPNYRLCPPRSPHRFTRPCAESRTCFTARSQEARQGQSTPRRYLRLGVGANLQG